MTDRICRAIQEYLDDAGDGWQLSHWFVAMGLERIEDGRLVTGRYWLTPPDQAEYVSDGLLDAVIAAREDAEADDPI